MASTPYDLKEIRPPCPPIQPPDGDGAGIFRDRLDGDARELFDGREACGHLGEAVVPESPHAFTDRRALDLLTARLRDREALELLAHRQQLEDADPALVAGLVATRAALLAVE